MYDYRPSIGESLTYPVESTMPNVENWNSISTGEFVPTDRALWAESGEDYQEYMRRFAADPRYGKFKKPFSKATMMVQPTKWNTGYSNETTKALNALALSKGEANKVADAIGVVNNSIQRLEALFHQADKDLTAKKKLSRNSAYIDLAKREAMVEFRTLNSDIAALEALIRGYGNQLSQLRGDGRELNEELEVILEDYRNIAAELNINDGFDKKMAKEITKASGTGLLVGVSSGAILAAGALFLLLQTRRSPQRVRSTRRGADGLFFRA